MELTELEVLEENEWKRYGVFAVEAVTRQLDPPIKWGSRLVSTYTAPQLILYDLETGELFRLKAPYFVERDLQRQTILSSLRPRPRHFANFVLQFRNYRRGTTPGLTQLARWYADLYGMRSDNVRRYIPTLKEAGVVETDELLGPLFQMSKVGKRAVEFLAEDFLAFKRISLMRARKECLRQQRMEFVGDAEPLLEPLRQNLAQSSRQGVDRGVVVPLEHLEGLVPGHGRKFDDVWQLDREPCSSGMAEVVEPHVFYASPIARSFEAFV